MPKFVQHIKAKSKRQNLLDKIFLVFASLYFLLSLFSYEGDNRFRFVINIFMGIYFVWFYIDRFRTGKQVYSLEITDADIRWLEAKKTANKILIDWNDIRWIKKEKNGGITVFRDSSFSEHFPLIDFLQDDREEIIRLLQEKANARQIRLINFSEPASAVA